MAKHQHGSKKQVQLKKQAAANPTVNPLQPEESLELTGVFGREGATIQTQAAWLSDLRMKSAQKHMLAAQIGRVHGNQQLHRMLAASKEGAPSLQAVQRHSIKNAPPPVEEEEIQTKPLLQRHSIKNAPPPVEEEEIQTKLPVQRQALKTQPAFGRAEVMGRGDHDHGIVQRWKKGTTPVKVGGAPKLGTGRVQVGPITFKPKEIPADGATTTTARAKVTPGGRTIKWGIEGKDYGSTISPAGVITPGNDLKGKEKVELQVKAEDTKVATAFAVGSLTLWNAKTYQAIKDYQKFVAKHYKFPKFVTDNGFGKFDVDYNPAANLVNIIVKVRFSFPEGGSKKFRSNYRKNFINQITAGWSKRYQVKNVREPQSVWGKLNPTNIQVSVQEVDKGQHFKVKVYRKSTGTANVNNKGRVELFKGDDVPHQAFNPGDPSAGITGPNEVAKVDKIAPKIVFASKSVAVDPKYQPEIQFLADYLKRINNPKFKVEVVGYTSAVAHNALGRLWGRVSGNSGAEKAKNQVLSEKRAQAVEKALKDAGLAGSKHVLKSQGQGQQTTDPKWDRVKLTPSIDPAWKNFQDVTLHEFGHMLGLDDEYIKGLTTDHYALVKKAFGQKYADFVAKIPAAGATDSASLMEGGSDMRIHHYVTLWDALAQTTLKAAVPNPKFGHDDWKLIG